MSRIARSLSSEFRKAVATRLWWILAVVLFLYSAMIAATFAFMFGAMGELTSGAAGAGADAAVALSERQIADMVYSSVSSFGYAIPLLLGALLATGELRHGTLGLTFTLEPRRGIVLLSKTLVLMVVGAVVGVAGIAGGVGTGAVVISATGGDPMIVSGETWLLAARALTVLAVWAIIGFGIGVLVRNQAITIVIALVFTQFVEPTLRAASGFWEWSAHVAKFLPGAATDSFVGASVMNSLSTVDPSLGSGVEPLGMGGGLLVLAVYAFAAVLAGWLLRWRGDVV